MNNQEVYDEVRLHAKVLSNLLKLIIIMYMQVMRTHPSNNSDHISDFCDGSFFKNHLLFSTEPNGFQIVAYFDKLEVCNPLGSRSGINKLGNPLCRLV